MDVAVVDASGVGDEGDLRFLAFEVGLSGVEEVEGGFVHLLGGARVVLGLVEVGELLACSETSGGGVLGVVADDAEERFGLGVLAAGGIDHALGELDVGAEMAAVGYAPWM